MQRLKTCSSNPRTIVAVGDSNGASEYGWVAQLRKFRPRDIIINYSVSGNTFGFDNRGEQRKNTLRNMIMYLQQAENESCGHRINDVIINLGTNDCKAVFADRLSEIPCHLEALINRIQAFSYASIPAPNIMIVSPPPYGPDSILKEKYHGGSLRVARLVPELEKAALKHGVTFVNIYDFLKPNYAKLAPDGVHMEPAGQKIVAELINKQLDKQK